MKNYIKDNWISVFLLFSALVFGLILIDQLPEKLPSHWDSSGQPDGYSSKSFGIFFVPLFTLSLTVLIYFFMNISPKDFEMKNSRKSIGRINFAISILMTALYSGMLLTALDSTKFHFGMFFGLGMGLFLIVAGNVMSKVEKNFFIGVRVPWTLASEKNWHATHRFAAKSMFVGGVVILCTSFIVQQFELLIGIVLLSMLLPVAYSFWFFKTKESL